MKWTKEQEQAINETGTNIIVSAGAGSGKTAVLTERVLRILSSGIHINELLVLTFTKAAAGEMKERIRKSLKEKAVDNKKLNEELELLDQSYITTFDSFALSVVKKYHYLLNISNNIRITDSSIIDMQKKKIMDETFDFFYSKENPLFNKLIYDFCVKDDKDIKKCLLKIADKIDAKPDKEEYLNNYINTFFANNFISNCLKEYEDILKEKVNIIDNSYYELSLLVDESYKEKVKNDLEKIYSCKTIDDFYYKIPLISLSKLPNGSSEEVKKAKDNLKKDIDSLKDLVLVYKTEKDMINSINKVKDYTTIIIDIIKMFINKLHKYKEDNNIYDFQDIALLSIRILKENNQVAEELKYTFKEIMIDEYQDTNDIQEEFIKMISNDNVYMVGDIKQSIYRFRNANPYIFKNKYDLYSKNINGLKIDLVQNFRSRKEVLSSINIIFNLIMDDLIGGAEYSKSHQMVYGNNIYIEKGNTNYNYDFEVLEYEVSKEQNYSKEEIEIFTIAKDIKEKISSKYQVFDKNLNSLRDITYKDFVILMDRSTDFELYKKVFEYLGIPLTLYKDEKLNNSNDIYILKNIIDYIVKISLNEFDTIFKYNYISIARSYLFSMSDDEIFNSFKTNNFKDNIVYETFKDLANDLSSISINTLLEQIINRTNMYEKMITIGDIDSAIIRVSKLIDIASNLSELGYDIFTFRTYLIELLDDDVEIKYPISNDNSNSVKIMTIHKSKGLEYNICYYSGLYKEFNIKDLNEKFIFDNKYGIISPFFEEGINDTFIKYLVRYHYLEEEVGESIRLFYVALTRAKEKIILLTPSSEETTNYLEENNTISLSIRRKYRSFSQILNSIKFKISKYYKTIDINSLNITKEYLYNHKSINKLENNIIDNLIIEEIPKLPINLITKKHFSKESHKLIDNETRKNMNLGTLFHQTLEFIDLKKPDYSLIENNFISNKIKKLLSNPLLSNINNANIYKEYEFIYEDDFNEYRGIIDLMIEYDNHIDIIDYKLSNIKDDNYLNQLQGYKKYISTIVDKDINIYLYSIINEKLEKI